MELRVIRDKPQNNRFVMAVTEVPPALRGHRLGSQLAEALVGHARRHGLRIVPTCSFMVDWGRRHPEYQDVLGQHAEQAR